MPIGNTGRPRSLNGQMTITHTREREDEGSGNLRVSSKTGSVYSYASHFETSIVMKAMMSRREEEGLSNQ